MSWPALCLALVCGCDPGVMPGNANNPSGPGMGRGGGGPGPDGDGDGQTPTGPGPGMFAAPQPTVTSQGGSVLAHPRIVALTFDGDPDASQLEQFVQRIGTSSYWTVTTSEYGVGPASGTTIHAGAAPSSLSDGGSGSSLQSFLSSKIRGQSDPNAVYVMFFPAQTKISMGCTQLCGYGPLAYHSAARLSGGTQVAYAVVPRCPPGGRRPPLIQTDLDFATVAASHELIEAVTDPWGDAFNAVDDAHSAWAMSGAETGDMCVHSPNFFTRPSDVGFLVQRTWSNRSAKAGHDPCVPQTAIYFSGVPRLTDSFSVPSGGGSGTATAPGIRLQVGQPKTIEVDLSSDGPTAGPWMVQAIDESPDIIAHNQADQCQGGGSPPAPLLSFSWDRTSGSNGDRLQLTVTAQRTSRQPYPLGIQSTLGNSVNVWFAWFEIGN